MEKLCENIKSGKYRNILVIAGAGISTASGIPDFRTSNVFKDHAERHNIDSIEEMLSVRLFYEKPNILYDVMKDMIVNNYKPSVPHQFIKKLHELGVLGMCITQNIDGLELDAGIPRAKIMQVHGNVKEAHCIKCDTKHDIEKLKEYIKENKVMYCTKKHTNPAPVKPKVVLYGENIRTEFKYVMERIKLYDCLIIMGTSLKVFPTALIPDLMSCDKYVINGTKLPVDHAEQIIGDLSELCLSILVDITL